MKHLLRLAMIPGALLLAVAALGAGFASRGGVAEAAYGSADSLTMTQACAADGTVDLTLNWVTYNQGYQWVDMSSGASFAPGTFTSSPQLVPNQNSYVWHGLMGYTPYYVRVNTQMYSGWTASPVVYFTTQTCQGYGSQSYGQSSYSSQSYGGQPAYGPMYGPNYTTVRVIRVPVIVHKMHHNHQMMMHRHY